MVIVKVGNLYFSLKYQRKIILIINKEIIINQTINKKITIFPVYKTNLKTQQIIQLIVLQIKFLEFKIRRENFYNNNKITLCKI